MVRTVIREALALYRRLWRPLAFATALIFLPFSAVLLAIQLSIPDTTSSQQSLVILDGVGSLLLFAPLAAIVIIRTAIATEADQSAPLRHELGEAFSLLPTYVITQLLVLLVIVALPGVLIIAGWLGGSQLLLTIGLGTLLGSAILNGVRLALATVAVVTGDARMAPALRRSAVLTRGRYWSVLAVILIFLLFALVIALFFSSLVLAVPGSATQAIAGAVLGLVANALTVPLVVLGTYRLYRTLQAVTSA